MKLYILFILFFSNGCIGQSKKPINKGLDTAKLFNPHPESEEMGADQMHMFERNLSLVASNYILRHDNIYQSFKSIKEAGSFIPTIRKSIGNAKFYLIINNSTSFDSVYYVIQILAQNQITDYQVVNYQTYITQPQPLVVTPTEEPPTKFKERDSAFIIKVAKSNYKVTYLKKDTIVTNIDEVATLIKSIRPKSNYFHKIIISGTRELVQSKQDKLLKMLGENGYDNFSITDENY